MRLTWFVGFLALAVSASVHAQTRPEQATPQGAARLHLESLRRGEYLTAARTTHPARLRSNRQLFDSLLHHGKATYLAQRIFSLPDSAALVALDDAAFTAGLFQFWYMQDRRGPLSVEYRDIDVNIVTAPRRDSAQVVYRWLVHPDSFPLQSFNVQTMVRCGTAWCAALMGDYRNLARLLAEPMVPIRNK